MLNPTVQTAYKSFLAAGFLFRMLVICAVALYVYEALYGLISGVDEGTGLFGYLIGFELIIFFDHTFALLNWLFVFLFGRNSSIGRNFLQSGISRQPV